MDEWTRPEERGVWGVASGAAVIRVARAIRGKSGWCDLAAAVLSPPCVGGVRKGYATRACWIDAAGAAGGGGAHMECCFVFVACPRMSTLLVF